MAKNKTLIKRWKDRSIVFKLFFSVILCILFLLLFNWLLNNLVLENYYQSQKRKNLESIYNQVNQLMDEKLQDIPADYGDVVGQVDMAELKLSIDSIISGGNYRTALYTQMEYIFQKGDPLYFSIGGVTPQNSQGFILVADNPFYLSPGEYRINMAEDSRSEQKYITLTGVLNKGVYLIINAPLETIRESVDISNRFLILTGLLTLLLSSLFIFRIARGFAKPIQELCGMTNKIAQMDFSQQYEVKRKDEIGLLAQSINQLSSALEQNISELKTANAQLERDNKVKTKQVETRREFIANASHELKTPIALIMAYAEGLLEDVSGDEESRKYYCEVIRDEADKMSLLIKKMTSLMQLESGEEELSISHFELTEVIANVLKRYSILLEEKRIGVDYFVTEEYYVWGDAFFIENVLNNYISNAANHVSDKGEICVTLEERQAGGARHVRVNVFNTGEQIPEEDLAKIWESFYKVDKARTRQYGGTGIGLSVVSAIMHAHNMPFGVHNEENGVSFWFELEM